MDFSETLRVVFPADSGYLPHVRGLVSDATLVAGFGQKFAYRTELVVDELLGNAVRFGTSGASVRLTCELTSKEVRLSVSEFSASEAESTGSADGLEIVRMLSSSLEFSRNDQGEAVVQVVRTSSETSNGMEAL
jgi:hypothetical protein